MSKSESIGVRSPIPAVRLHELRGGEVREFDSSELFAGKTVIVFALPGAFTPTCSSQHLPRFEELAATFHAHGIDEIVCISVNDPFVLADWQASHRSQHIHFVADGNTDFTRAMGLLVDHRALGMGLRSRRYSMLVRSGIIETLFVEADEPGDPYRVSDADTMLDHCAPGAARPPRIVLFTKPGCPFCARAIALLEARGYSFDEFPLRESQRLRVLGAVANASTTPQVFIDGRLIGGADDLKRHLETRAAAAGF